MNCSFRLLLLIGVAFSLTTGCGMFGRKPSGNLDTNLASGSGCLNDLGKKIDAFTAGTLSDEELSSGLDCVVDAHKQFIESTEGSESAGYSPVDLQEFSNIFLFTNLQVSSAFVESIFDLKASILGGKNRLWTREELQTLVDVIVKLKPNMLDLLGRYRELRSETPLKRILGNHVSVTQFFSKVIEAIPFARGKEFPLSSAIQMADELETLFDLKVEHETLSVGFAALALVTHGRSDAIESERWPQVAQTVLQGVSLLSSYKKLSDATFDKKTGITPSRAMLAFFPFVEELAIRILAWNNGAIEITRLQGLLDQIPEKWLETVLGEMGDRSALNKTFEPLLRKLLGTNRIENGKAVAMDSKTITTVFELLRRLSTAQLHLDAIFENAGAISNGLNRTTFLQAASLLAQQATGIDLQELNRLIRIATLAPTLYEQEAGEMSFSGVTRHTLTNLSIYQAMDLASETLLKAYGNGGANPTAGPDGIKGLLTEFEPILLAAKLLDKSILNYDRIHLKNFRQANLYTTIADGNEWLDRNEVGQYLASVMSISNLSARVRTTMTARCGKGAQFLDPLGWEWMNEGCFRVLFFQEASFFDHFPLLNSSLQDLSLRPPLEIIARRVGFVEGDPIGSNDVAGYVGFFHFIEMMMMKFDTGAQPGILTKEEILGRPYNEFKSLIIEVGRDKIGDKQILGMKLADLLDDDSFVKALFTWIIDKGKIPETTGEYIDLGWWWKIKGEGGWAISADRAKMVRVMSLF